MKAAASKSSSDLDGHTYHDRVVTAEVVDERHADAAARPACTFTRPELQALLERSGYGAERGAYSAYFRPDPLGDDGGHVCRTCGLEIGLHAAAVPAAAAGAAGDAAAAGAAAAGGGGVSQLEEPDTRPADLLATARFNRPSNGDLWYLTGRHSVAPRHWVGSHWYLNLLAFDGFAGTSEHMTQWGYHHRTAETRWRCVAPSADGTGGECGATFVTVGVDMDGSGRAVKGAVADMSMVRADADAMERHFTDVHRLEQIPAGGWSTGLSDCCEDSRVAAAAVLCPFVTCSGISNGVGLWVAEASVPAGRVFVLRQNPDESCCSWGVCCVHALFSIHLVGCGFVGALGDILTLCGFPCNSDSLPPLLCFHCYFRRRELVRKLAAPESPMQTRCVTVFCCPCSECQQWREVRDSGVWPGLACCAANEADSARMAPSAVRARFSVGGAYGVRAQEGAGPFAQQAAEMIDELPGPAIGWRMT